MGRKMAVFILSGFPCLFPVFDFPFQMQSSVLMKIKDNMSVCTHSVQVQNKPVSVNVSLAFLSASPSRGSLYSHRDEGGCPVEVTHLSQHIGSM